MANLQQTEPTPRVSVLIPTRDRPRLLLEAIESVRRQTYRDWELIVIDDGSTVPIALAQLGARPEGDVKLIRQASPRGQATAREIGEQHATGQIIFHLDDDDLLAPDALAAGVSALQSDTGVDIVFYNVVGFGERAEGFNRNQTATLERVLGRIGADARDRECVRLAGLLFPALLGSVPMAFQRPMAWRPAWRRVTQLRRAAYGPAHPLHPPLRESEWALYAAATTQTALLTRPRYLQRCSGQGYFSIEAMAAAASRARIEIIATLAAFSMINHDLFRWANDIERRLAKCHFDQAYSHFYRGSRLRATQELVRAMAVRPDREFIRFGLRMLLPRGKHELA